MGSPALGNNRPTWPRELPWVQIETILNKLNKLEIIDSKLNSVSSNLNTVNQKITEIEATMAPKGEVKHLYLDATPTALQGLKVQDYSPCSGKIIGALISWPLGCNDLVNVAMGVEETWLLPAKVEGYLALNDATPFYELNHPVQTTDKVWMRIKNGDDTNPHHISLDVFIREE